MTRPRLQLHLSTLLIVSLLAAGLVWLNVRAIDTGDTILIHERVSTVLARGWPQWHQYWVDNPQKSQPWDYQTETLVFDAAICLTLLAVATVAIESATRRMKRGAP